MRLNEGMRDAIEALIDASRTIDQMFDGNADHQKLHVVDAALYEENLKRIHMHMYHLQRCERLNNE